jgi:hypothetical protein
MMHGYEQPKQAIQVVEVVRELAWRKKNGEGGSSGAFMAGGERKRKGGVLAWQHAERGRRGGVRWHRA